MIPIRRILEQVHRGNLPMVQAMVQDRLKGQKFVGNMPLYSVLYEACETGQLPIVQYMIEQCGADVHADGDSALCHSAMKGHLSVVEYLVEHGADVHCKGGYAIRKSEENGHVLVTAFLRERVSE